VRDAKNAEARMCSPLHIRASIKVAVVKRPPSLILSDLVAANLIANLVSVDGRARSTCDGSYDRALLSAN
jgi:hypothetical protein